MLVRDMDPHTLEAVAADAQHASRCATDRGSASWAGSDGLDRAYWRGRAAAFDDIARKWGRRAFRARRERGLPPRCSCNACGSCRECGELEGEWPMPEQQGTSVEAPFDPVERLSLRLEQLRSRMRLKMLSGDQKLFLYMTEIAKALLADAEVVHTRYYHADAVILHADGRIYCGAGETRDALLQLIGKTGGPPEVSP